MHTLEQSEQDCGLEQGEAISNVGRKLAELFSAGHGKTKAAAVHEFVLRGLKWTFEQSSKNQSAALIPENGLLPSLP